MRIWLGTLRVVVVVVVVVTMQRMGRTDRAKRVDRVGRVEKMEMALVRRWSRSAGGSVSVVVKAGRDIKISRFSSVCSTLITSLQKVCSVTIINNVKSQDEDKNGDEFETSSVEKQNSRAEISYGMHLNFIARRVWELATRLPGLIYNHSSDRSRTLVSYSLYERGW
jgi:hypothetical protein